MSLRSDCSLVWGTYWLRVRHIDVFASSAAFAAQSWIGEKTDHCQSQARGMRARPLSLSPRSDIQALGQTASA